MKKAITLLLALMLVSAFLMVGCDNDNDNNGDNNNGNGNVVDTNGNGENGTDNGNGTEPNGDNGSNGDLFEGAEWSMEIADGWAVTEAMGMSVLSAEDGSGSNINVIVENMQGLSLEDYLDVNLEMLEEFFDDFDMVDLDHVEINGKDAIAIAYASGFMGVQMTYQFFVESDGTAFIITYTRMDEADRLDDVLAMLDTFTIR